MSPRTTRSSGMCVAYLSAVTAETMPTNLETSRVLNDPRAGWHRLAESHRGHD